MPLTSLPRQPHQCRPCSSTRLRKDSPALSPCLEGPLPVPPCDSLSIHLQLSLCLRLPHFHSVSTSFHHPPISSCSRLWQSLQLSSLHFISLSGETHGVQERSTHMHLHICTYCICVSQRGGRLSPGKTGDSLVVGECEQIRQDTHTNTHIIVCQAVSWQPRWLREWRVRWWQVFVRTVQVIPPVPIFSCAQACVFVCVCVCQLNTIPLRSKRRQLFIHLSAGLRSADCRLFVYNQHHQQLVWNQSAVTRRSEHHEHSSPRVCPPSLGVVTAGPSSTLELLLV